MDRREFTKIVSAAVAGVAAGTHVLAGDEKKADKPAKHVCKGRNECKGQGG